MDKVRLALMMLILLGSVFANKNLAVADASKQLENLKLKQVRSQTPYSTPVLLGLYAPDYLGNQSTIDSQLRQVDQSVGKRHSIAGLFLDIEDSNPAYNIPVPLEQLKHNGYTAFINLKSTRSAAQIARGDVDSSLQKVAKAYADWVNKGEGRMAFIAPLQEMNIPGEAYSQDPQNFKLAYQRIQKIFKEAGVSSQAIRWVFAPNGWSEKNEHRFENYYPGDKSVDVVAFSSYNWGYCSNSSWKHWNTPKEVFEPYIKRMKVMAGSKATNYLTNDPYLLWGLEMGWNDAVKPQVQNLFKVQQQRFKRTGILTAVNEDSLDRPPYFLYYSVYSNGQSWQAVNTSGKAYPKLRFVSTKAAFSWFALMPDDPYTKRLRDFAQNLSDKNRGYFSGRYENSQLGVNASVDINTNAIVLESLLYQARGRHPLILEAKSQGRQQK